MGRIHSEAPYYDDYDASKHYSVILTKPGYGAQARENTQLQTMLYDYMGRLGDYLIKEGSIIDGCVPVVVDNVVTITAGRIYFDGLVRLTEEASLQITGQGLEVIGCKLKSEIINATQDPSLYDPAAGADNYGQEGADRLKETIIFTKDDPDALSLWTFNNGELVTAKEATEDNVFTDILARRTYDESGSYKVEGLELFEKNLSENNKIYVSLAAGKAYIRGYEVTKPTASTLEFNKSLDFNLVQAESYTYTDLLQNYPLSNQPCKQVIRVVATVAVTETDVTRGDITGGKDLLAFTPVQEIKSVKAGNTTYVQGTDFVKSGDYVDWAPGLSSGHYPARGTSYKVEYTYNKVLIQGTDFEVFTDTDDFDKIRFISNDKPVINSLFYTDYEFYLARKDLVCMDRTGEIHIFEGKSDTVDNCEALLNNDPNLLDIGSILFYPNSDKIICYNYKNYRITMNEIYNLQRRIDSLEYNQAVENLDDEAKMDESGTNLKGIYTDGFIGVTKADLTHSEWQASIDLDNESLTMPFSEVSSSLSLNTSASNVSVLGQNITASYASVVAITQNNATKSMLVNPYAVYDKLGAVKVSPAYDNWIDSSTIKVSKSETQNYTLRRWWYHRGEKWAEEERQAWINIFGTDSQSIDPGLDKTATKVSTTVIKETVLDEAILYMRRITLTITATNFTPNSDNIICYFDDRLVNLTPVSGYSAGTQLGSMRANAQGKFVATLVIPDKVACGTVNIKLQSLWDHGSVSFTASGRKLVTKETILTTQVNVFAVDPLAQTFQFTEDKVITKVGLFFASKDPSKSIIVQIKNVDNGYPGSTVYAQEVLLPNQVNISSNGTVETIVTLSNLVYCEANTQYAVAILSDSNLYSMYVAELGQKDIATNSVVSTQPYTEGVLFSSSNSLTWTAHQTMDLKFKIYTADFATSGSIVWNTVSVPNQNVTRFLLASDNFNPLNANIEYFYRFLAANETVWSNWKSFNPYVDIQLPALGRQFEFKVNFASKANMSPIFAFGGDNFIGIADERRSTYISKNIVLDEAYNKVRVVLDAYLPQGTSLSVYYATDTKGQTWTQLTSPTETHISSTNLSRYEYNQTLSVERRAYRIKIVLTTNNALIIPYVSKLKSILKY